MFSQKKGNLSHQFHVPLPFTVLHLKTEITPFCLFFPVFQTLQISGTHTKLDVQETFKVGTYYYIGYIQ